MLDDIKSVDDYMKCFVGDLTERLTKELNPLYDPSKDSWSPRIGKFRRPPFRAQGDALMGLVSVLKRRKSAFLCGECGVGKTLMGAGLPWLLFGDRYRVLIMCPGHLVEKWAREVTQTVPGATARIITRISDLQELADNPGKPSGREYYVIGRDRAKLGFSARPAFIRRRHTYVKPPRREKFDKSTYLACPNCAAFLVNEKKQTPITEAELTAKRLFCPKCKEALWQADGRRIRRYPPAEFIKRQLRGAFDLFIADEVHELKGADTAQGNVLGMLASAARKTLCLTGTLIGGYASHLFYILFRVNAKALLAENLKYTQVDDFVARYGAIEYITKTQTSGPSLKTARGSNTREYVRMRPGISPLLFARHLLGSTVFVELADVADCLPAFSEDVSVVEMSEPQKMAYADLERKFKSAMADRSKAMKLLGAYLMGLLAYPDKPFDNEPYPEVGPAKELPRNVVYPKERELLKFVREELSLNRKVWVFATFTNRKDVVSRLEGLIRKEGLKTAVLRHDTVDLSDREKWVKDRVKDGVEVVISNPELVKTGLDLLDFPSLYFYETGYNTFTLMQASRRSWRIGQKETVRVHYSCYKKTLQEAALRLMGAKVKATMALQGKFSAEGLLALTQSEDMVTALAKAMMNGLSGVDSAEKYWRNDRVAGDSARVETALISAAPVLASPASPEIEVPATSKPEVEEQITLDLFSDQVDVALPHKPVKVVVARVAQLELALS